MTSRLGRLSVRIPRSYSAQHGRQRPLVDFCNYFLPVHRGSNFSSPGGAQLEAGCKAIQDPEGENPGGVSLFDKKRPGQNFGGKLLPFNLVFSHLNYNAASPFPVVLKGDDDGSTVSN